MIKRFTIRTINTIGLILMLLGSWVFASKIEMLRQSDPVYAMGYIVGALIPIVTGYFLFRFKAKHETSVQDDKSNKKLKTIPITEYIKQYEPFESQSDLEEAELWNRAVYVKNIPEHFIPIIQKQDAYRIGFEYPSTASIFDMSVELPILFTKLDGSTLSLGIKLEDLELIVSEDEFKKFDRQEQKN